MWYCGSWIMSIIIVDALSISCIVTENFRIGKLCCIAVPHGFSGNSLSQAEEDGSLELNVVTLHLDWPVLTWFSVIQSFLWRLNLGRMSDGSVMSCLFICTLSDHFCRHFFSKLNCFLLLISIHIDFRDFSRFEGGFAI